MRFLLALCAIIGVSIWWAMAPEPLLVKPEALSAPDLKMLVQIIRDTLIDRVCSSHPDVNRPCECGEPINNEARKVFKEQPFDPLDIGVKEGTNRKKRLLCGIAVY